MHVMKLTIAPRTVEAPIAGSAEYFAAIPTLLPVLWPQSKGSSVFCNAMNRLGNALALALLVVCALLWIRAMYHQWQFTSDKGV